MGRSLTVAALLVAVIAVAARNHSVTVLLDFDQPHSADSVAAMQKEAKKLLASSGIALDVKLRSEVSPSTEFPNVLVFKMTGRCVANRRPEPVLLDERGPLAEAYETDGEILSFGEIHCDQVRSLVRPGASFGAALGRVLAHETYHMLGHTGAHTKKGITRRVLTPADLSELGPFLDDTAKDRLRSKQ